MKQFEKQGFRNKIGALGEEVTVAHLRQYGYEIIEQNYLKPWGEIDIVARENDGVAFVEVKTVSYETCDELNMAVTRETWRPEDNVHYQKRQRLGRTIQTWIVEHGYTGNWRFLIAVVRLVPRERFSVISLLEEVIPE